jgi:hypothetical protein
MVAGGRYELYSHYPVQIQAVAASIAGRVKELPSCPLPLAFFLYMNRYCI